MASIVIATLSAFTGLSLLAQTWLFKIPHEQYYQLLTTVRVQKIYHHSIVKLKNGIFCFDF